MKYLLLVLLSVLTFNFTHAQESFENKNPEQQKIVTENGDELCVVSNGNKVPCVWVEEAEKSIQTFEVEKKLCYKEGTVIDCEKLDDSGNLKFKEKTKIYRMYIERYIILILFLLIFSALSMFIYKKYGKNKRK